MCHRTCIRRDVAQLSWRERGREKEGESGDTGTLMDEYGVDLLLCLPTLNSTPIQLRLVLN